MTTAADTPIRIAFDNRYARELEGLYLPCQPTPSPAPQWLKFNHALADELGLDGATLSSDAGLAVLAGNVVPEGAQPIAQAYAGHQFGGFAPQLGDGRALLLGEVLDRQGQRRDIAFKGSGRTPFSRGGDGKAAVGPVLREYLVSEAMHALGIPTTRTLAAVATGETIRRQRALPGAVLTRVAASHVRVGTFEFFAARQDSTHLQRLADHVIARFDPHVLEHPDKYLELLRAVVARQARLVARWMAVGFVHGVMNTDNTTVSGETIDYGPCAFMEAYDPATVFSSIDHHGRYAYGNQPSIAHWNLARLAEALLPLIDTDSERAVERATAALDEFPALYASAWRSAMHAKLGLAPDADPTLLDDYLQLLLGHRVDFTLGFRHLADTLRGQPADWQALFTGPDPRLDAWWQRWHAQCQAPGQPPEDTARRMDACNPLYIPRNHQVEAALDAATDRGDLQPFERLLAVLTRPYQARTSDTAYALPGTPEQSFGYQTFCGT